MSVFLWKEAGFNFLEVGLASAVANIPMLLSPGLITLLADRNVDSRRILAGAFVVSCVVMLLLYAIDVLWIRMVLFLFHGLAFVAMLPLQDGFYFSYAEDRRRQGESVGPYPTVRIWGTIGYIVPSVIVFFMLRDGGSISRTLLCGFFFGLASLTNTFTLPYVTPPVDGVVDEGGAKRRLPTTDAFRRLFSPEARYLCLGLTLCYMASISYGAFISIYLKDTVGMDSAYIGLVINFGVAVEVLFTLWMPWLQKRLRLKGIMIAGICGAILRTSLLATFPGMWTGILTQLVHGIEVLALFIAPVMFLDRLAGDRYRNSIQGVFTMTVGGLSRIVGATMAGWIASHSVTGLMGYAACLSICALLVIVFLFKRIPPKGQPEEARPVIPGEW